MDNTNSLNLITVKVLHIPGLNDTLLTNINTSDIENLLPGYYKLYVEDNLTGCSGVFGLFLFPKITLFSIDNVLYQFDGDLGDNDYNGYSTSCPGASDGIIIFKQNRGSGNYFIECFILMVFINLWQN